MKTPFKKGIPGKDWYIGLQGRHPELALKGPQRLSVTRAKSMNKQVTKEYFDMLKGKLDELNVQPEFIWNCDEINIQLEHKPRVVIGRKGSNVPGRVASSKESVSILGCGNAMGRIMSPMVIVKGKTEVSHGLENRMLHKIQNGLYSLNHTWTKALELIGFRMFFFRNVGLKDLNFLLLIPIVVMSH